jgi:isochorismate synthase
MPEVNSFFKDLEKQFANDLPFVVYSRPINSIIKCWLQKDAVLHRTNLFEESGFVFAPFDLNDPAIVFPEDQCEHQILEVNQLDVDPLGSTTFSTINTSRQGHVNLVSEAVDAIKEGPLKKVVLSRVESRPAGQINPIETFKRLFNTYKNAMVYCWYHPKVGLWLGATPELLFKVEGSQLTAISLAGTQPYQDKSDPTWTSKELQEQQIVTDYIAEQVSPYSAQTKISETESIKAGNLWHLKTRVTSVLHSTSKLKLIIEALHPTPAVCGFPKQIAKDFILSHEGYEREFYTGFLGELNLKQRLSRNTNRRNIENNAYASVRTYSNFYVNLRCMQIKDDKVLVYVGGGITEDSVPENEWEETSNKAKTISNVLR